MLHGLWDGLPAAISVIFAPGLDVFIGQVIVGFAGLFILWLRYREARRLQIERMMEEQRQAISLFEQEAEREKEMEDSLT